MSGIEGDYLSDGGFWALVAILCALALIVITAELLRERADEEIPSAPPRLVCDLELCDLPSAVEFDAGNLDGRLYICAQHAGQVSEWAPVSGVRAPFDQEATS